MSNQHLKTHLYFLNFTVLRHYAASSVNSSQTFRDNLSGRIFKLAYMLSRNVGKDLLLLAA